jgi:hypothetical protein
MGNIIIKWLNPLNQQKKMPKEGGCQYPENNI